ncbi:hypothetical protein SDRG_16989 [Saprolegnia diclina VS20]|uniref:F-box domain-containing protein n=1 Tax=Saprolegnia diclina (strain VS20) TaxID=1156394 RepID=T0QZF5_SAPDV|nr:hypothetical protein SDRG_16989 [Saprolegnia diclina VS20]EQC25133.1 hypothetical protein SDRG_16989 [Saprolegnia diclina VS20]|eukprot:XP_008621444.1 hypothetical protein SDRG_16989 [Saprolegnia diclina VS20]
MAADLSPDLVQLIVMYMADEADVASLLLVLPPALLSAPLAALRTLFRALFDGELVGATRHRSMHLSLWPPLVLPYPPAINKPILIDALQAASSLYASLTTRSSSRVRWDLPPHLTIELPCRLAQARHVFSRIALWDTRLSLLSIQISALRGDWARSDVEKLALVLPTLPRLRSLHLCCAGHNYTFEIGFVLKALFTSRSLTQLSLTTNVWSEDIGCVFAKWLTHVPVSSLKLRGPFPMKSQVHAVVHAIRACRTLQSLALEDAALARAFVAAPLPAHLCELDLRIDRPTTVDETTRAAAYHPHLEALRVRLSRASLPPDNLPLVLSLPTLRRLRRLDLIHLELVTMTRDALWTVLPRLTELRLEKSHLGDSGVAEITAVLPTCYRLHRLALVDQGISDTGALAIARSLVLCPSLTDVDLTDNAIASDGAIAFWPLLPNLIVLRLRRNRIGEDAAMALSDVLRLTAHMRCLDMSDNNIGLPAVRAMITALHDGSYRAGVVNVSVTPSDYEALCSFALGCLRDPHRVDITRLY